MSSTFFVAQPHCLQENMSLHRYGRYGPDAWKRRQQRQFQRRLPAIVLTRTSMHVQVPANTGRIIFIVFSIPDKSEPNALAHIPSRGIVTHPAAIQFPPMSASVNGDISSKVTKAAEIRVELDVGYIATKASKENPTLIPGDGVKEWALAHARRKVSELIENDDSANSREVDPQVNRYQSAYVAHFNNKIGTLVKEELVVVDPIHVSLARKAHDDYKRYDPPPPGKRLVHPRDLAIRSALRVLYHASDFTSDWSDWEEKFEKASDYADTYELFYNAAEEVIWPDSAPFSRD